MKINTIFFKNAWLLIRWFRVRFSDGPLNKINSLRQSVFQRFYRLIDYILTTLRHGRRDYMAISLACFLISIVAILFVGCAHPAKKLEAFSVERVTVFCAPPGWVDRHWERTVGKMAYGEAYAMIDGWNHIYIPCIEIDGKLMPEDQNALGHEIWHLFNRKHPDRIKNPDY